MSVGGAQKRADGEVTTLELIVAWAEGRRAGRRRRGSAELALAEVAVVARQAALLVGDRPLREVTFGELALLPAMLEAGGLSAARARAACRDLGTAFHLALCSRRARRDDRRAAERAGR